MGTPRSGSPSTNTRPPGGRRSALPASQALGGQEGEPLTHALGGAQRGMGPAYAAAAARAGVRGTVVSIQLDRCHVLDLIPGPPATTCRPTVWAPVPVSGTKV